MRWSLAAAATFVLALLLMALPPMLIGPTRWNWAGHLLALAGLLAIGWRLSADAGLGGQEMGFTVRQRPGSARAAGLLTLSLLLMQAVLVLRSAAPPPVTAEDLLFQATLPGLFEEALLRAMLPAMLDRAFPARRLVLGASFGWGTVVATLLFLALHATRASALLAVLPLALALAWLRATTGSLLWPLLLHNAWNLLAFALRA